MPGSHRRGAVALALLACLTGCGGAASAPALTAPAAAPPAPGGAPLTGGAAPSVTDPAPPPPGSPPPVEVAVTGALAPEASARARPGPTRVTAPAIGLAADLVPLGLLADGALEVPVDPDVPGWYTGGPRPGEPGPAVIAGHVDSQTGPAVFFLLPRLRPGDEVRVGRTDGSDVVFRVDRVERHPKDRFPTAAVYGAVPGAELRLITCGGEFDRRSSHYVDNVVVFATRVGATPPAAGAAALPPTTSS